jgi:hypothetical protein
MTNNLQVLIVPVDAKPYLKEIPNTLDELQKIVGGRIEFIGTKEGYNMFCNEEGKLMELEPNIYIHGKLDFIAGQFFVCKDDGVGDMTSISKTEAEQFLYKYVIGCKVNPSFNVKWNWDL